VTVDRPEATDTLAIDAGVGNDTINAAMLAAGVISLSIDAGDGNDTVTAGQGNKTVSLGNGNDTFIANPAGGSDLVDGGDGTDTVVSNGPNLAGFIDISASGSHAFVFRQVDNALLDLTGVEHIQLAATGGADVVGLFDLTGTDVTQIALDLSAPAGSNQGDGQPDQVFDSATTGDDSMQIVSSGSSILVNGLQAQLSIKGS